MRSSGRFWRVTTEWSRKGHKVVASNGQAQSAWLGGALLTLGELQSHQGMNQAAGASLKEAVDNLRATLGEASPESRKADALLVELIAKTS